MPSALAVELPDVPAAAQGGGAAHASALPGRLAGV